MPIIKLVVYIETEKIGLPTSLCDTGSTINCINANFIDAQQHQLLQTVCQPVGANESSFETGGDVKGFIEICEQ